jgi:hypothetical protein|tara:strand:- start:427 stop:651 length:225 start_codon:yes stop_codon:yes gene_type:complete
METFIIIVMVCTFEAEFNQEYCVPLVQDPKVYYIEEECAKQSIIKRKQIQQTAKEFNLNITRVFSSCINEGKLI